MENLKAIIEALLFAADAPLTAARIVEILGECDEGAVKSALLDIKSDYSGRHSGIAIVDVAGGIQMRTREDLAPWIRKLKAPKAAGLSQPALETLAVIAYRQPIMKSEIERIRGVDVSGVLKGLLEKSLIRIVGRKDVPGKPIIYGTNRHFLEVFGLRDLSDLPTLKEMDEEES